MSIKINSLFNILRSFLAMCGCDISSENCSQNVLTVPGGVKKFLKDFADRVTDELFYFHFLFENSMLQLSEKNLSSRSFGHTCI